MFTGSLHQFQPVASAAAAANDTIAFTPMLALTDNSVQTTGEQTFTFSRHYSFKGLHYNFIQI
jgi:hypothetical protein